MRVSRKKATFQSGPKKGKLKPGCRFIRGDGADCKGVKAAAKTAKKKTAKKKSRKSNGGTHPCARPNPPDWCNKKRGTKKRGTKKRGTKSGRKGTMPSTPKMDRLNAWRRAWKQAGSCQEKREALRSIKQQFQHMAASDPSTKRGETTAVAASRRWSRWQSEYRNKLETTEAFCSGRPRSKMRMIGPGMVNGLGRR